MHPHWNLSTTTVKSNNKSGAISATWTNSASTIMPFNSSNSINEQRSITNTGNHYDQRNQLELWPYRHQTEHYREPAQDPKYQSRLSEHPYDKLNKEQERAQADVNGEIRQQAPRIAPPSNSTMRLYRNTYFS